jgi:hypothetical protein
MPAPVARAGAIVATVLIAAVGVINLLPGIVAFDPARTQSLYGIALDGDSLVLLMRHRAVLLAIVGALLLFAAWRPAWRPVAIGVALASKLSFVAIYLVSPPVTTAIARVAMIDAVAIILLVVALPLDRNAAARTPT